MLDFKSLFEDLRQRASKTADDLELEKHVEQGKELGVEVIEKIKTDRSAQLKAGGGALLLAALLGTNGGRKLVGTTAKVGVVAGLGALAYRAWQQKNTQAVDAEMPVEVAGYVTDDGLDETFAEALVRTMVTAAWADGALDQAEHAAIAGALEKAGSDASIRRLLLNEDGEDENLKIISRAARSPNHAAQLYAAAAVVTGEPNAAESGFLDRLAMVLGIESGHAGAIKSEAAA